MAGTVASSGSASGPTAPPQQEQKGPGFITMAIQLAFMFLMFTWLRGQPNKTSPAPLTGDVDGVLVTPVATPTPSSAPGLFDTFIAAASGKNLRLPAELAQHEDARLAAIAQLAPNAPLRNAWPQGTRFDVFVFLSECADILDVDFANISPPDVTPLDETEDAAIAAAAPEGSSSQQNGTSGGGLLGLLGIFGESTLKRQLAGPAPKRGDGGHFRALLQAPSDVPRAELVFEQRGLALDWSEANYWEATFNVSLPPRVTANESRIYAHIFLARWADGGAPSVVRLVHPLIKLLPRKPRKSTYNLLGAIAPQVGPEAGKPIPGANAEMAFGIGLQQETPSPTPEPEAEEAEAAGGVRLLPYWKPTLAIQVVPDWTTYPSKAGLPPHVAAVLQVQPAHNVYLPITLVNDFWLLGHHLVAINDTVHTVPLTISFGPTGMMKWSLMASMEKQWEMQASIGAATGDSSMGGGDSNDLIKSVLMDTNPILLAVTMVVSTLHMVFDFLAFKNDISFWRGAKTMEGLSVRSIGVNFFFQLVILLYLFENETSWMVLMSSVVGVAIEFWKLRKAVSVSLTWSGWWPKLSLEDKEDSYSSSGTKTHDEVATSHMLFVLAPMVAGYALYSLLYEKHRSWYSWALTSTTGFIYTFGFIQMVPQLYINYKLKSVAHMPWRAMVYKSLNTFIDDLFAFVVKMPWMHRIACLRDDVIFIIFIIQRFSYPVDKTRRNEFGTSAQDVERMESIKRGLAREPTRPKREKRARQTTA